MIKVDWIEIGRSEPMVGYLHSFVVAPNHEIVAMVFTEDGRVKQVAATQIKGYGLPPNWSVA